MQVVVKYEDINKRILSALEGTSLTKTHEINEELADTIVTKIGDLTREGSWNKEVKDWMKEMQESVTTAEDKTDLITTLYSVAALTLVVDSLTDSNERDITDLHLGCNKTEFFLGDGHTK